MTLSLNIEYILGSSNTLMAKTYHNGECIVEHGSTFEEAKRNVVKTVAKREKLLSTIPPNETITIDI